MASLTRGAIRFEHNVRREKVLEGKNDPTAISRSHAQARMEPEPAQKAGFATKVVNTIR